MNPTTPAIRLLDVSKIYESRSTSWAGVHNVSLDAHRGELVLLLGPSGSGKTTLLTLAAGLTPPTLGRIEIFGQNVGQMRPSDLQRLRALHVGFVFQTFRLIDALTVEENVALVRRLARGRRAETGPTAADLLLRFGLAHLGKAFPNTLSQGERQRLAITRALANDPELIIADEPTASLPTQDGLEVIRLLHTAAVSHSRCVLVATHDLRLTEYADRVVVLRDGRVVEEHDARGLPQGGIDLRTPADTHRRRPQEETWRQQPVYPPQRGGVTWHRESDHARRKD